MKCEKCGKDVIMTVPLGAMFDLRNFKYLCICDPEEPCTKRVLDLKRKYGKGS